VNLKRFAWTCTGLPSKTYQRCRQGYSRELLWGFNADDALNEDWIKYRMVRSHRLLSLVLTMRLRSRVHGQQATAQESRLPMRPDHGHKLLQVGAL
jgi:hypothetical protein